MKKFTISTCMAMLFLLSVTAFSQNKIHADSTDTRSLIFSEDFSGGEVPPAGWTIVGDGQENWQAGTSSSAGGTAPEAVFQIHPSFIGNSKLLSPQVATSAFDVLILQFNLFVYNYTGGAEILIETTADGQNYNAVWSVDVSGTIHPQTVFVAIDNEDVGSDSFQLAFTFNGDSYSIYSWHLDNIMLNENLAYDAEASNILVPSLSGDNKNIAPIGIFTNKGTETISFPATVEILDETSNIIYSRDMTVSDLASFESKVLTFPTWFATEGIYTVNLTTSLVGDENPGNDYVSSSMEILEGVIFKQPLYEEFTSSTCGPCALQNPPLDAVLAANPISHSLIKYQVDWPGSGDPYYTPEVGARANYYDIYQAPKLLINTNSQWVAGMTQEIYDSYIGLPTTLGIDIVTAAITPGGYVSIEANINVSEDFAAGLTAHVVVVEKTTHNNAASNGEDEFTHVMMKMLPDANGTTLEALSPGNIATISESYDMTQTFMEEFTDLAVIVFVQDDNDKTMLQSEMMDVSILTGTENLSHRQSTVKIFPNPASDNINIQSGLKIGRLLVYNQMGQRVIETQAAGNTLNVNISDLERGIYLFKVINENGSMVKKVVVE